MKSAFSLALVAFISSVTASPLQLEPRQGGSTDPFMDSSLPGHTIYLPTGTGSGTGNSTKWPVLIWGNGACSTDGRSNIALLKHVAANGFIAISEGGLSGGGSSNAQTMKQAIDWISKTAGTGRYANVDASRIMAAGFSCGGVEAMDNIFDERVDTIGVVSSGLLSNTDAAKRWNKPVLFVLGGSGDIAYQNGERDYRNIPAGVPVWKGNIPVGHGGTLGDANGGRFGKAILAWMQWYLKGDQNGAQYLKSGYSADGWQVQTKDLDKLKPLA